MYSNRICKLRHQFPRFCVGLAATLLLTQPALADITDLVARANQTSRPARQEKQPRVKFNDSGEVIGLNLDYVVLLPGDLEEVAKCHHLESLSLAATSVTDDQLKLLVDLKSLKFLVLNHTGIGDDGLKHLGKITTLRSACLLEVNATRDGVNQLKRDLPRLSLGYQEKKRKPGE